MPDNKFKAKTLIGNWFEERCDPSCDQALYYKERKELAQQDNNYDKAVLHGENYQHTSQNWLNFQPEDSKKTFETLYMQEFHKPEDQKRNSVLKPFLTKKGHFDGKPEELEAYKQKWTKGNQIFDRNYLGEEKK